MNQIRSASLLASFTIALAVAVPTPAQTIPPDAYGALRWRLIGPHRGGLALAVAAVPGAPATVYFAAVHGGVVTPTAQGPSPALCAASPAGASSQKRCTRAPVPGLSPSREIPTIPRSFAPLSTRRTAHRGSSTRRTNDRGGTCTRRPTVVH